MDRRNRNETYFGTILSSSNSQKCMILIYNKSLGSAARGSGNVCEHPLPFERNPSSMLAHIKQQFRSRNKEFRSRNTSNWAEKHKELDQN